MVLPASWIALVEASRPRQWTKNLMVFAGPLFSFRAEPQIWLGAAGACVAFCLVSSAIYLINDVLDREEDRRHPSKRFRAIASGRLAPQQALIASSLLLLSSLLLGLAIHLGLAAILLLYAVIQLAYCLRLKREPLLDILCIASGFLLRAMAGVLGGGIKFSPWFLLTVGLLALFLAVEKRKAELRRVETSGVLTRKVLRRYSLPLLLRLESLVSTSAFMSYALWAAGPALRGASSSWMLITVPFVLVGIFRYQLLSDPEEANRRMEGSPGQSSEKPEEILLGDRGIQLTLVGWLLTVIVIGLLNRLRALPPI
ncbi:MAG: decaprenyl-phosphate phosphoribosyltransferase [Cyanobacteriota bacterium]|nr:decaprenyl-phosphate phosphoribosyltransferase [Cyanobacteriota bacterium]